MSDKITFIKSGLQTSIQDFGRKGLMDIGVSPSGAIDKDSLQKANWLVGKPKDSAAFEITLVGPTILFSCDLLIAICGAEFELSLNNKQVQSNQSFWVKANDTLSFGKRLNGCRAYLAFCGQFNFAKTLNSFSTHLTANIGGFNHRAVKDNDEIPIIKDETGSEKKLPNKQKVFYSGNYQLRTVSSVETQLFTQNQINNFYQHSYQVLPQSNRMGIRLNAQEKNKEHSIEMVSSGIAEGNIQIPPSGKPIISSVDGQTIGGYPRIASIISADLPILGQLCAGDKVNFEPVTLEYAEKVRQLKQSQFL